MKITRVRIGMKARKVLADLAARTGEPAEAILDRALEAYWRKTLLEDTNRAYDALRRDPEAWARELAERAAWDSTIADGLEEN